jgi:gas vesicle protein
VRGVVYADFDHPLYQRHQAWRTKIGVAGSEVWSGKYATRETGKSDYSSGAEVTEKHEKQFRADRAQQDLAFLPQLIAKVLNHYGLSGVRSALGIPCNCISRMRVLTSDCCVFYRRKVMSDHDGGNSFVWFLAGLGLGALVGVLYAPRAGSETRDVLRARAEEGRDYVKNRAREARDQASDWVDRGRDMVNQQKDQFRAAYEAGRQAYQEATTESGASKNL